MPESQIVIARSGGFAGTVALAIAGGARRCHRDDQSEQHRGHICDLDRDDSTRSAVGQRHADHHRVPRPAAPIRGQPRRSSSCRPHRQRGNVTVDFSTCSVAPIWFAIQDGTGPWSQILGSSNIYRFDITSSKADMPG